MDSALASYAVTLPFGSEQPKPATAVTADCVLVTNTTGTRVGPTVSSPAATPTEPARAGNGDSGSSATCSPERSKTPSEPSAAP